MNKQSPRWDKAVEHDFKENINCDVLIYDNIGVPFLGSSYRESGLGGSEFEAVLLAEALAEKGKNVVVINRTPFTAFQNGVRYRALDTMNFHSFNTKSLIIMRGSKISDNISFEKAFVWCTDNYSPNTYAQVEEMLKSNMPVTAVFVSAWQKAHYPSHWPSVVIHNMIPDWVYDYKAKKHEGVYIYASAALKGLNPTLSLWTKLKKEYHFKKAKLLVLSPGYDQPSADISKFKDVEFVGALPFEDTVSHIARSEGMFYVSEFPETFGISPAMAEVLGTKPWILRLKGQDAMSEVLNTKVYDNDVEFVKDIVNPAMKKPSSPNNFKISNILPLWESILV